MSDLQLALIGAGIVVVIAVWAYNHWQERKLRRTVEAMLKPPATEQAGDLPGSGDDVGMEEGAAPGTDPEMIERREPGLVTEPFAAVEDHAAEDEPTGSRPPVVSADVPGNLAAATELPVQWTDVLADCILRFDSTEPIPAPALWTLQAGWSSELSKPFHWLAFDPEQGAWRRIDAGASGRYTRWAVSLQLADRGGPVSDSELTRFFDGVGQVTETLGARIELPAPGQEAMRAARIDEFCASVDIQFRFHVVEGSGGVFAGTKLRGLAEALGLSLEADGAFHARDTEFGEAFVLGNLGAEDFSGEALRTLATHGITLTLDVPRTRDGALAFTRMVAAGEQLARGLGGVLVDTQRVPLSEAMIAAMRGKIIELQQRMREADIEPGSIRALRLFS
ncbi:MAG: hypothetical protein CVU17_07300 [Betaproteobacteria bacterium HGW-Betaproteobacteria-11]|nr:MAG: hypothetical protein CVU17_07300 [Betaproteobacteria bacterium HGW-Betaproteobacteria-11]